MDMHSDVGPIKKQHIRPRRMEKSFGASTVYEPRGYGAYVLLQAGGRGGKFTRPTSGKFA